MGRQVNKCKAFGVNVVQYGQHILEAKEHATSAPEFKVSRIMMMMMMPPHHHEFERLMLLLLWLMYVLYELHVREVCNNVYG